MINIRSRDEIKKLTRASEIVRDLLFEIEQAIATGIQYMIYNTLNSNYLYLLDTLK